MSTSDRLVQIGESVRALRSRLDSLGGSQVRILAVGKGFPWIDISAAMEAGVEGIGENYSQEVISKYEGVPRVDRPEIHFIGRLQSNKIAQLAPFVATWQSVDRLRLIEAIAQRCPKARIMIQVNTTDEENKGGCSPDEVEVLMNSGVEHGLDVVGLMVVGPTSADRERIRQAFSRAARLRSDLGLAELSMGMSADLDIAVESGTTMVRVGSGIFGSRPPKR